MGKISKSAKVSKNIEELLSEEEALTVLKLKEEVLHPNLSWRRHWRSIIQLIFGMGMIFGTVILTYPLSSQSLIYGNMFILFGLLTWQQKESKEIHHRIDKLIELQELAQTSKKL